jgi:hypothetical protein
VPEPEAANAENISGVWHGIYSYADGHSLSFIATLLQIGSDLSGTTEEPCTPGGGPTDVMVATLSGRSDGSAVQFVKTYQGRNPYYASPVAYEGRLNGDATEIEGRWTIHRAGSGTFLMIRTGGKKAAAARKATERV